MEQITVKEDKMMQHNTTALNLSFWLRVRVSIYKHFTWATAMASSFCSDHPSIWHNSVSCLNITYLLPSFCLCHLKQSVTNDSTSLSEWLSISFRSGNLHSCILYMHHCETISFKLNSNQYCLTQYSPTQLKFELGCGHRATLCICSASNKILMC